jgi:hypothetical protein
MHGAKKISDGDIALWRATQMPSDTKERAAEIRQIQKEGGAEMPSCIERTGG